MKITADWLKLDTHIFEHKKIRRIRRLPDGDSIFTLWIYLLCEGMKNTTNPGAIEMTPGTPDTDEDISFNTEIKIDTIRMGLKVFKDLGMIVMEPPETVCVKNMRKHQSIDRLEYKRELANQRVRRFREKKKLLQEDNETRNTVTCNATEQSRAEQSRKEKKKEKQSHPPDVFEAWDLICSAAQNGGGDHYKKLDKKIKDVLKKIGGFQKVKLANDFQTNQLKNIFVKAYAGESK